MRAIPGVVDKEAVAFTRGMSLNNMRSVPFGRPQRLSRRAYSEVARGRQRTKTFEVFFMTAGTSKKD